MRKEFINAHNVKVEVELKGYTLKVWTDGNLRQTVEMDEWFDLEEEFNYFVRWWSDRY